MTPAPTPRGAAWLLGLSAAGLLTWAGLAQVATLPNLDRWLLLAALVVVPLGMAAATTGAPDGPHRRLLPAALASVTVGAIGLAISFAFEPGPATGWLAVPWLLATAMTALFGIVRLLVRGLRPVDETAIDAGLVYLFVGGLWMTAARFDASFLGFDDPWVSLTAAHFHTAGFAMPILAGLVGRGLAARSGAARWRRAHRILAVVIIASPPAIALGITASPHLEVVASVLFGGALVGLAVIMVLALAARAPLGSAVLFVTSALALVSSMALAVVYALTTFTGVPAFSIDEMIELHGATNVAIVCVGSLIGFLLWRPVSRWTNACIPFSRLSAGLRVGPSYFDDQGAVEATDTPPTGLVDRLAAYDRNGFDAERVPAPVRRFYEHTDAFSLYVVPEWRAGFRLAARFFRWVSGIIGQVNLPRDPVTDDEMESRVLSVRDAMDGRDDVRAWVRTYTRTGAAVYVAAYAIHRHGEMPYMNIAFPLPGGNMTSVLRLDHWLDEHENGDSTARGVALTTLPVDGKYGDQGVYFANRCLPIRLPFDETITVTTPGHAAALGLDPARYPCVAVARHDMWLVGVRFLTLYYWLDG